MKTLKTHTAGDDEEEEEEEVFDDADFTTTDTQAGVAEEVDFEEAEVG
jgi:hypothetical protein